MKRVLLSVALVLLTVASFAQAGMTQPKYYFTGSLRVGTGSPSLYADTSLWLQISDGKGIGFPKVNVSSYATTQKAVYVYNTTDSFLYQIDGSLKLRYLNIKDTILIKTLISQAGQTANDTTSLSNRINQRVKYTDTSSMLTAYRNALLLSAKYADTSGMLAAYQTAILLSMRFSDTATMLAAYQSAILSKVKYSDTSGMLSAYQTAIAARVKYTDTAGMLAAYQIAINSKVASTRSIATTYPLQGGGNLSADRTLTLDTTVFHGQGYYDGRYPQISVLNGYVKYTDTSSILSAYQTAILARVRYADTSAMLLAYKNGLLAKLNIADTGGMLAAYQAAILLKVSYGDTTAMLSAYQTAINARVKYSDTTGMLAAYQSSLATKVKYTDTAGMLANYATAISARVKYADTSGMLANYVTALSARVKYTDTAGMLANYSSAILARVKYVDTSAMLSGYQSAILLRVKYTDTASMLATYASAILLRVKYGDTTGMLSAYQTAINARVKYTDTTGMLSAYQTAINGKEPTITAGTTGDYWRGDKSWRALNTGNVPELVNLYYTDTRARASISLTTIGTSGVATYNNTTGVLNVPNYASGGGTGDVVGPASATDNAITRFDLTTGKLIQNSGITIDDNGAMTFPAVSTQAYASGKLYYDSDNDCISFLNSDNSVSNQFGQETWIRVKNSTGSSIPNGTPVYVSGADVTTGRPTVAPALSSSASTVICIGLTTEAIANGATGFVTSTGVVNGLNTSGFTSGASVFVDPTTPGTLTTTAPTAPNYRFRVGIVGKSDATTGTIVVTPSTGALGNGTANQVFGMNNAGTAQEVKTIASGTGISVVNTANTITINATGGAAGDSLVNVRYSEMGAAIGGGSYTYGIFSGSISATGTAGGNPSISTTNKLLEQTSLTYTSASTAGSSAGARSTNLGVLVGNSSGYQSSMWSGFQSFANTSRVAIMMSASTIVFSNADPSSFTNVIGVSKDIAETGNFLQLAYNDGSGTCTKVATTCVVTAGHMYKVNVKGVANSINVIITLDDYDRTGLVGRWSTTATTNLPALNTLMTPQTWVNNGVTAATASINWIKFGLLTQ